MATNTPEPTVTVTAGKNTPVKNVLKFEDLVQQLKEGAPVAARQKGAVKAAHREHLSAIQELAADLEQRLRAVRRALPDSEAPAPRSPRKRKK